jgi:hypothetical protein
VPNLPHTGRAATADDADTVLERRAGETGCRLVALATTRAQHFYRALGYDEHAAYFRKLL